MEGDKVSFEQGYSDETVRVVVRCRPMSDKEIAMGYTDVVKLYPSLGVIEIKKNDLRGIKKSFTFDSVYDSHATQENVYEASVRSLVDSVLEGYNGTIFAYGQTGTGKTYTMEGSKADPSQRGIISRSFDQIFNCISLSTDKEYLIRSSYLEIYQEEIRDLLSPGNHSKMYELREAADRSVYVKDLPSFVCNSAREIEHIMYVGNHNRSTETTNMNDHSSRSHAIFIITIEIILKAESSKIIRVGKLNLIDLSGSEKQNKTGATGDRLREASKINLSLCTLGKVISALADGKNLHIPYRDSKLTRLLQDSLGGNSKTIMIANIGPANYNYEETLTTLRYANRTKNIKNNPNINQDPIDTLLREYHREIKRLKDLLAKQTIFQQMQLTLKPKSQPYVNPNEQDEQLLIELKKEKECLEKDKLAIGKLEMKISTMESKLLGGSRNIMDHTKEQQRELENHNQKIDQSKIREVEMLQDLEFKEESTTGINHIYFALQQEINEKSVKIQKYKSQLSATQNKIKKVIYEFETDTEELQIAHEELCNAIKVNSLIIENLIPATVRTDILKCAQYDECECLWLINKKETNHIMNTSEEECKPWYIEFRGERNGKNKNILILDLEPHLRNTSDYNFPTVNQSILDILENVTKEEDLVIDAVSL